MGRYRTPFVGRRAELDEFNRRLVGLPGDAATAVFVGGEPGVGKTRLVSEVARGAGAAGHRVLVGRAYEPEGMPPYFPFVELLRDLVPALTAEELHHCLGDAAGDVALLSPAVRARVSDVPATATSSAEHDRHRLFE